MKFSEKWLKTLVEPQVSIEELTNKLTFAGLEVEEVVGDIIDLGITPNRGDCLSLVGIAREVAVIFNKKLKITANDKVIPAKPHTFKISLQNDNECPKYLGRVIKNINNKVQTPDWIGARLNSSGLNLISPVVDITNYVMLELGQPMHAFELNKIDAEIIVRKSNGEKIELLDGQEVTLDKDTLVIADKSKVLAVAGIMGGVESGVIDSTKDILLESAYFSPEAIRKKVQKYNIHTDSSYRFERGVDFNLQEQAIERATKLILDIAGGEAGSVIHQITTNKIPKVAQIILRKARLTKVLGTELETDRVTEILQQLGMELKKLKNEWIVTPPSFRTDIKIEEDLIEEIARIIGYNEIPTEYPVSKMKFHQKNEQEISDIEIKRLFTARGYNEAITYSFIDPELALLFADEKKHISLKNPIASDMSIMRPSLIPGLLMALARNQARQEHNIKLFEVGLRFRQEHDKLIQQSMVAGVACGNRFAEHWSLAAKPCDFFDIKGDLEAIFAKTQVISEISFKPFSLPYLHSGQTATINKKGVLIGVVGAVHPAILKKLDLAEPIFVFELDCKLLAQGMLPNFKPLSKYPAVRRDLALVVDESISVAEIAKVIKQIDLNIIKDITVFDVYQGSGVEAGKKSIAVGITLQDKNKTLTDEQINSKLDAITSKLKEKLKIFLRK